MSSAGTARITGVIFSASPTGTAHSTICSYATPFRVGVHFDTDDSLFPPATAANAHHSETYSLAASGAAMGYQGFYLNYFQVSC